MVDADSALTLLSEELIKYDFIRLTFNRSRLALYPIILIQIIATKKDMKDTKESALLTSLKSSAGELWSS